MTTPSVRTATEGIHITTTLDNSQGKIKKCDHSKKPGTDLSIEDGSGQFLIYEYNLTFKAFRAMYRNGGKEETVLQVTCSTA